MNDPLYNQLREAGWKRPLTLEEEADLRAWLANHPDLRAEWESEAGLTSALRNLPDVPVPGNFTARVLDAAAREEKQDQRDHAPARRWSWRIFLPRTAAVATLLVAGLVWYQQQLATRRAEIGQDVAAVSSVAAVSDPDLMRDLEPIRRMGQAVSPDEELLALLQ